MSTREILIKSINNEFSVWEVKLQNLGSINLVDAHHLSEDSICKLLNIIFDYKLKNLNSLEVQFPAIDLGDEYNSVCFQVTSEKSGRKIQKTINAFIKHNLHSKYQDLFVIVLGKKQIKYSAFEDADKANFSTNNILDFKDLLKQIRNFPIRKLESILKVLRQENLSAIKSKKTISNATKVKKRLALEKKLAKDFIRKIERKDWDLIYYEPWYKFTYQCVNIRSVDDTMWPKVDANPKFGVSSWFKAEFWNFYDNGIEFVEMGGDAIFDKNGFWDLLSYDDKRGDDEKYKVVRYRAYTRIPYDFIVTYDMDTDPYNGYPTIYVEYENNGTPFESILFGTGGHYKTKEPRYLFDESMRRKLK